MNPVLIEPTDVLFFRDAIPMSAGQGKGAGARMPFPSTLHEAFRASLLRANGETTHGKSEEGRPRDADRRLNWHGKSHEKPVLIATKAFRSLRTVGPLPLLELDRDGKSVTWKDRREGRETGVQVSYAGLLLPVPADVAFETQEDPDACPNGSERKRTKRPHLRRLTLWRDPSVPAWQSVQSPADFRPLCLPLASTPPDKHGQLSGWWTLSQYRAYFELASSGCALEDNAGEFFRPLPTSDLWSVEHRVGVQIDPGSGASAEGQLYAGNYLRADRQTRFVVWTEIADPTKARDGEAAARESERKQLDALDWLLLGGEFRLARLWRQTQDGKNLADPLRDLRHPPAPPAGDGPCLLKWVLVTPAIFAHGSLPGWCADSNKARPGGTRPVGQVCLDLPGRSHLISWCLGKPRTVSGFDVVEGRAKPTMLAVPEGGVYYFLCEDRPTAAALAGKLHWQPRSDFYGEKGCGYGLVSFDVRMHPPSATVGNLAKEMFP
jgi:CRISPR type III-B/RAMP module-associated protein Cmr3